MRSTTPVITYGCVHTLANLIFVDDIAPTLHEHGAHTQTRHVCICYTEDKFVHHSFRPAHSPDDTRGDRYMTYSFFENTIML
jgi:hypothetical protein